MANAHRFEIPWPVITQGPVVDHLPQEAIDQLYAAGREVLWRRGDRVARRGVQLSSIMIVVDGRLGASTMMPFGEENLLGWLRDRELFGVPSVLAESPFPVDITADSDSRVLHVARGDFLRVVEDVPGATSGVSVMLSHRLVQLFDVIDSSGYRSLGDRLLSHLRRLAAQHGLRDGEGHVELKIAQGDLAAAVGASRQRIHIELHKLQSVGELRLSYRKVVLLDSPASPPQTYRS